jgi:hypothetical protein
MSKTQLLASSAAARETVPEAGRVKTKADPTTVAERGSLRKLDRELLRHVARRRRAARSRKKKVKEKSLDTSAATVLERATVSEADLMTAVEFAKYRRCSLRTLDRERATGCGCPYVRLGARVLYRRADVDRYIEQNVRGLKREGVE